MDIQVTYQIGFNNPRKKNGKIPFSSLPSLENATAESVGTISGWAGSYHILAMGRHFRSYVIARDKKPLPENGLFPYIDCYKSLDDKSPASTITGNIGQTLTALYATQFFKAGIADIVVLDPKAHFTSRKTPDFLIKINSFKAKFPDELILGKHEPSSQWWPVECKARKKGVSNIHEAKKEAFLQLVSFWVEIYSRFPSEVGYGIITIFINSDPPTLHLVFIIPKEPEIFQENIRKYKQKKATKKEENDEKKESLKKYTSIRKELDLPGTLYGF